MKITAINLIEVRCSLAEPVKMSFGLRTERRHLFVEIVTDKGIKGIGDSWTNFPYWAVDERKITLEALKKIFIGMDPLNINAIWNEINQKIFKSDIGLQYGSKGPVYQALSGIDIALWDIAGKAHNVPVYGMLGGALHGHMNAYASGITSGDYKKRVPGLLENGFEEFKVKVGFGTQSDTDTLKTVRELIGTKKLYADANQKWQNAAEAIREMRQLSVYGVNFFEEPVNAALPDEYKKIRVAGGFEHAAGENLYGRNEFHNFMNQGLVDIIQPDVTKSGGITESWAVCEEARLYGVRTALHMYGTAIGLAASLQIMFASTQAMSMEYDVVDNVMMTDLASETFYVLENGRFVIAREMPGIGIALDEDFMNKYGRRV